MSVREKKKDKTITTSCNTSKWNVNKANLMEFINFNILYGWAALYKRQ